MVAALKPALSRTGAVRLAGGVAAVIVACSAGTTATTAIEVVEIVVDAQEVKRRGGVLIAGESSRIATVARKIQSVFAREDRRIKRQRGCWAASVRPGRAKRFNGHRLILMR